MIIVWVLQCTMSRLAVLGTVIGPNPRQGRKSIIGRTSQTTLGWHNTSFFFFFPKSVRWPIYSSIVEDRVSSTPLPCCQRPTQSVLFVSGNDEVESETILFPFQRKLSGDQTSHAPAVIYPEGCVASLRRASALSCLSLKEAPTRSWASLHLNQG